MSTSLLQCGDLICLENLCMYYECTVQSLLVLYLYFVSGGQRFLDPPITSVSVCISYSLEVFCHSMLLTF